MAILDYVGSDDELRKITSSHPSAYRAMVICQNSKRSVEEFLRMCVDGLAAEIAEMKVERRELLDDSIELITMKLNEAATKKCGGVTNDGNC